MASALSFLRKGCGLCPLQSYEKGCGLCLEVDVSYTFLSFFFLLFIALCEDRDQEALSPFQGQAFTSVSCINSCIVPMIQVFSQEKKTTEVYFLSDFMQKRWQALFFTNAWAGPRPYLARLMLKSRTRPSQYRKCLEFCSPSKPSHSRVLTRCHRKTFWQAFFKKMK